MSLQNLHKFLDSAQLYSVERWISEFSINFIVTKNRVSKLGDYRKLPDNSHQISINGTLPQDLFFFVTTHEIAHLFAFEKFGRRISSHGREWKVTFAEMLRETLHLYPDDLQEIIYNFSKNPKANFMAWPELVFYFRKEDLAENEHFLNEIAHREFFIYKNQKYRITQKRKKNYLCTNLSSGKMYVFSPLAKVQEIPS